MGRERESMQWYARRDGVTRGPFTAENITRYLLLGRINLDDELSRDRRKWSKASSFGDFLPPELANLTSWEDYQQLVMARMEADERSADRRIRDSEEWLQDNPERRRSKDRRQGENTLTASQYLFSDTASPFPGKARNAGYRTVLLSLLLVVLVFAFLLPPWI